jgi:hypothetical protein
MISECGMRKAEKERIKIGGLRNLGIEKVHICNVRHDSTKLAEVHA